MTRTQNTFEKHDAPPPEDKAPWMNYAGFVETGDPRSSDSIDETVYDQKD